MIKRYRLRMPRKHVSDLPATTKPSFAQDEPEVLTGVVQGKPASMGEERFARSLSTSQNVTGFEFRMTVGAQRNMPGFKELDFAVSTMTMMYAIEIDTPFTHRNKASSDILHDAIVLKSLAKKGTVYPQVFHVIADSQNVTDQFVKRVFG